MSSSASHDATLDDGQVSNTDKIVGIAIASVAAFLYASGLCVQRAALTVSEPDTVVAGCHGRCCQQHSTLNWAIGLLVYGVGGLFLGTLALRYIPLSLSSSIFSSVLVFNALVARVWLKELVQPVDLLCYILIIAGITIDAYYLPDTPNKIDVHVLEALWKEPIGIAFWVVVLSVLLFLQGLILCRLERKDEVNGGYDGQRVYKLAMISYPVVLGTWEGVAYMCLKAGNDILDHISDGRDDQTEHWLWWLGVSISLPMCIVIVVWVRKSYSRFPTTQIFPLELGALTIVSVNGGLLFYKEYEGASRNELFLIYGGIALMLSAMVTVTYFKSSLPPIAPCDATGGATDPAVQPEQAAQEVEALTTHSQSGPHPARQEGYQHSRETDNSQHLPRKTETGYVL